MCKPSILAQDVKAQQESQEPWFLTGETAFPRQVISAGGLGIILIVPVHWDVFCSEF